MNTFELFGIVGTGEYAADAEDTLVKSGETYSVSFTKGTITDLGGNSVKKNN